MSKDYRGNKTTGGDGKRNVDDRAVVPRGSREVRSNRSENETGRIIAPKGYTMRKVEAAKNNDVISMARAMNADLGPRVQKLFEVEKEAALDAARTGIYIGWRCPDYTWDCQRVGRHSRCFCGHSLSEHDRYNGNSVRVPCKACKCKAYAWMASKPEEIGEFWFARRRDFDVETWRAKCRCKHTHEQHDPNGMHSCKACGCGAFDSNFLCAACDKHWEEHETFFDTEKSRREKKLPYGEDYLPFSEIPSLRNMVLTGEDDGDMSYLSMKDDLTRALPSSSGRSDNGSVVPCNSRARYHGNNSDDDVRDRRSRDDGGSHGNGKSRRYQGDDDYDDDVRGGRRDVGGHGNVKSRRSRDDDDYDDDVRDRRDAGSHGNSKPRRYQDDGSEDDDDYHDNRTRERGDEGGRYRGDRDSRRHDDDYERKGGRRQGGDGGFKAVYD